MKLSTLAGSILVFGLATAHAFAEPEIRPGDYAVKGKNLNGSPYSGTAHIAMISDSTCEIVWNCGGVISEGICMRNSDRFVAAYRMGSVVGLIIYTFNSDGSLNGYWTIAGKSGAGTETLTPQ